MEGAGGVWDYNEAGHVEEEISSRRGAKCPLVSRSQRGRAPG